MFNEGISKEGELIELGADLGFVKRSGSFYSFGDTRLGQGRENAKQFLRENPDIAGRIEDLITGKASVAANGAGSADDLVVLVGDDDKRS